MTGTSADGIDVALVGIEGTGVTVRAKLLHHLGRPMNAELRRAILNIRNQGHAALADLAKVTQDLTVLYADAIGELLGVTAVAPAAITAIGAHGQTLFHDPPLTMQVFDPSLLAARVECVIVSDFRRADCAAGGQGAPLVPWADWVVFRHDKLNRAILNIGGIANVTYLPAAGNPCDIIAFDTGPGNCLSDDVVRRAETNGAGFDQGGQRALRGTARTSAVDKILAHPWFSRPPPKSTDGPAMIRVFRDALDETRPTITTDDLLATAACVTALTISDALRNFVGPVDELILAGGGVANSAIMKGIREMAGNKSILMSYSLGIPTQAREAMAFALLAAATIDGVPGNVVSATGASRGVVCGSITPKL